VKLKDQLVGDFSEVFLDQTLQAAKTQRANATDVSANFEAHQKRVIHSELVPEFLLHRTLYVKSGMGTGKTQQLIQFIRDNFAGKRVLFLSFRRTFTSELTAKLNEKLGEGFRVVSYRDVHEGVLDEPYMVVQFESLHRIQPDRCFDLVVLDESESIIAQTTSGLGKNVKESVDCFERILKEASHVVALDANLS
jgi:late competence protein required for DNA uptake (superfamily II DNA/RNA helicase)